VGDRAQRDTRAACWFLTTALGGLGKPTEVVKDRGRALRAVIDDLVPAAFDNTEQHANNRVDGNRRRLRADETSARIGDA
jgi:transposase-like protein